MPFRVLITRAPQQNSELADHLRALGAEPVLIPAIETVNPGNFGPFDTALAHLHTYTWLLFTSANAVEAFAARRQVQPGPADSPPLGQQGLSHFAPAAHPKIAAVGPATARALQKLGLAPDLVPPQAVAESLAAALLPHALQPDGTPTRFLLLRAEEGREHLPNALRAAGADVTVVPAYRTVIPAGSVDRLCALFTDPAQHPDAITFTSSSTVRNLLALCEAAGVTLPAHARRISIGPITSQTLRDLGYPPHAESPEATTAALAQSALQALNKHHKS